MCELMDVVGCCLTKEGEALKVEDDKLIGFYFSAHWCPPCRGFTPVLAEYYNAVNKEGKRMEIIFVSSDRDQAAFDEYYNEMPWAQLKFSERSLKEKLSEKYGVRGIPTFVVLNSKGETVNANGRGYVVKDKDSLQCTFKE